ncbi:MAG: transketolase [bacterium]|nr:transketolase [bacterium]
MDLEKLEKIAKLIRHYILTSTTEAGSGHPTSSLSATDLMTVLLYGSPAEALAKAGGFFHFDLKNPGYENNDRLIFSKGHASPLFYAMWSPAGAVSEQELLSLRKFGSRLEGHPTPAFKFTEAATGSLGQGLSVGVGMALNAKLDKLPYKTFVLLGDSEMAEGSVWEALEIAAHYKLDNLVAILDVNRLGQRGETMFGHDVAEYEKRIRAFGWETMTIDGHDFEEINKAFEWAANPSPALPHSASSSWPRGSSGEGVKPKMIIAKTLKGKGVSFIEDKDGWHGKPLPKEDLPKALVELGEVDKSIRGEITRPEAREFPISNSQFPNKSQILNPKYETGKPVATRKAYGNALARLGKVYPNLVALDGEVSNSTFADIFKKEFPDRFFEMYIAEQNMVGAALGFSRRGKIPFVSTFAAFFSRAFDQIRMSQYSDSNIKFCGSHAGVSIGEDGASQMGLEDIAMFRTLQNCAVLYPSDAISTEKLVEEMVKHKGNVYIRTTRKDTTIIYNNNDNFEIGGSKVLRQSENDVATVIGAGITLHEALAAYEELKKEGINIRVIDLYSIKPLDLETLKKAAAETKAIITVEDHFPEGGIGEAVASALAQVSSLSSYKVYKVASLAVRKMPKSGKPDELLAFEEIDRNAIISLVKNFNL